MICEKQKCYGCSACYNICPQQCIVMQADEEGFLYPVIDQEKCINCKLCISVCQVHHKACEDREDKQKYYALKNTDAIRVASASGGIFTALSDYVLANNGVVVGAAFNSDFTVTHKIVRDGEGRNQLRGTKYVQSDLKQLFSEIKEVLATEKQVLFVGTPCQVEGLNLFLKKKYEKLITCDLICHGAPSPKVFMSFIEYIRHKSKFRLVKFNFRDKNLGWRGYRVSAEYEDKKVKNALWLRSFNYLFSQNYINRPACSQCKYIAYKRCSDITIGDYWGVESYYPKFEDSLGVSLVMTNTQKGENMYQVVCKNLTYIEIKKEEAKQNSLSKLPKANVKRNAFWAEYREASYEAAIKKYGEYNFKGLAKDIVRKLL